MKKQPYIVLAISQKLKAQNIKDSDIPVFDDLMISAFFGQLYAQYSAVLDEALWQSVTDPQKVAYSKRKPDGSYTRVITTLGRWLKRIDPSLNDKTVKALSEQFKSSVSDVSWLTLSSCQDEAEIINVYADTTICSSCMSGASVVRVYDSPDVEVVYARHEGRVVGRAVCNRETKEFVRAYPTGNSEMTWAGKTESEWRKLFLSLLARKGYIHNTEGLLDCRLKYIGDDGEGRLFMPYIDGDYQCVSWCEGDVYAFICDDEEDAYTCNNTCGLSELCANSDCDGQIRIRGRWYNEDEVCYSNYNGEHLLLAHACHSELDNDYFYPVQVIKVARFSHYFSSGYADNVHNSHSCIEVKGMYRPILNEELYLWERKGYITRIGDHFYTISHQDVAWDEEKKCYYLVDKD